MKLSRLPALNLLYVVRQHAEWAFHTETTDEPKSEFKGFASNFVKRKFGVTKIRGKGGHGVSKTISKRKRTKSYQVELHINNMLKISCGVELNKFVIKKVAGEWPPNPFEWASLNLATDQGPDMVCSSSHLTHKKKLNIHFDWDIAHGFPTLLCFVFTSNLLWQ